ncbi:N-acetyltransferase family protein [Bordetella sp. 2513F-2]
MTATAIRPMMAQDIPAVRELLAQLGYPLDMAEVARRHAAVARDPGHVLLLAEHEGRVVSLCHLYVRPALEKPPEVMVQALVVDQACRGAGVGRRMMAAAEQWARSRGLDSVALTSNVARDGAHAFYEALGYERKATSHLFRKQLGT